MAKEIKWYGKTDDEIKLLDLKSFAKLIPARQRRSLQRGFTSQQQRLMRMLERGSSSVRTHCRDMVIIPIMLGKMIHVYNGKEFHPVTITSEMLGHYLGEFSMTRKSVTHSSAGIGATRSSKAISAR